jgi:hypothetical protein
VQVKYKNGIQISIYHSLNFIVQRRIQTQIMHNEKFEDTRDAIGIDEIPCGTTSTSSSGNQQNSSNNTTTTRPHR